MPDMDSILFPSYKKYIDAFRIDYEQRNTTREFQFEDLNITLYPGVFPSDSPYTFSSQSIILSLKREIENGYLSTEKALNILDLGTGSGIFASYLAKHLPNSNITASDVNESALQNAQFNFEKNNLHVSLVKSNLFEQIPDTFDVIVTSIPFVDDWSTVPPLQDTLEKFWAQVKSHLNPDGTIYFNWADWANFEKMETTAENHGFKVIHVDEYPLPLGQYVWRTYRFKANG